ncbi:AcrR family transcriptional regulator [Xanthomonas arboricola]|uniref:TetR/AcrR family transcriptional regulator n=1 Tax=Xanthomonas euroxanthea TaxID=2259622 RepID=UPI00141B36E4|nr:TetR/AcrR family transcriptional regulator [Xanthomonas euroxanthea]MBB3777803.1 AcrR family transcriptional regulator [Xanthomonas euroxanthea]NIK08647.1 AcrR family transcriptional regulator [Xanthomonas euroxanthea]NIK40478.1 AcrR family transcriptional regulator [Xanthomonas euroxanthea]
MKQIQLTKSTRDAEATRLRLREAAATVFAANGYHATKVSDIVAEAGVSQPAFYLYFQSKEAAFDALVAQFREDLRRLTISNRIAPDTPPSALQERVGESFRRFLDFMAQNRRLTEIGFFQPPSCGVTKAQLVGWVSENIVLEQAAGLFRGDLAADDIARCLVGLLDQMGRLPGDAGDRAALSVVCAKLFYAGVSSH